MGRSISWLAVHGAGPEAVRRALGLVGTNARVEEGDTALAGAVLPDEWYLVYARGCGHGIVSDDILRIASSAGVAVGCSMEEHVNFASASLWSGGVRLWTVRHRGDVSIDDLEVAGAAPPEIHQLVANASARQQQEEADWMCEVPIELARRVTGYTPDEDPPGGATFEALRVAPGGAVAKAIRPWWRFW